MVLSRMTYSEQWSCPGPVVLSWITHLEQWSCPGWTTKSVGPVLTPGAVVLSCMIFMELCHSPGPFQTRHMFFLVSQLFAHVFVLLYVLFTWGWVILHLFHWRRVWSHSAQVCTIVSTRFTRRPGPLCFTYFRWANKKNWPTTNYFIWFIGQSYETKQRRNSGKTNLKVFFVKLYKAKNNNCTELWPKSKIFLFGEKKKICEKIPFCNLRKCN